MARRRYRRPHLTGHITRYVKTHARRGVAKGSALKTFGLPAIFTGAIRYFLPSMAYEDAIAVGGAGVLDYLFKQHKEGEALVGAGLGLAAVEFIKGNGSGGVVTLW